MMINNLESPRDINLNQIRQDPEEHVICMESLDSNMDVVVLGT